MLNKVLAAVLSVATCIVWNTGPHASEIVPKPLEPSSKQGDTYFTPESNGLKRFTMRVPTVLSASGGDPDPVEAFYLSDIQDQGLMLTKQEPKFDLGVYPAGFSIEYTYHASPTTALYFKSIQHNSDGYNSIYGEVRTPASSNSIQSYRAGYREGAPSLSLSRSALSFNERYENYWEVEYLPYSKTANGKLALRLFDILDSTDVLLAVGNQPEQGGATFQLEGTYYAETFSSFISFRQEFKNSKGFLNVGIRLLLGNYRSHYVQGHISNSPTDYLPSLRMLRRNKLDWHWRNRHSLN